MPHGIRGGGPAEPGSAAMGTLGVPIGCPAGRGHGRPALPMASCKGRGVCPSCNGRHMAQTAAHLADPVIPPVPVRQWVISVPKRLRGFLADRPTAVAALTKIFLDEIERSLCAAAGVTSAAPASARPRLSGISFLHRFGSALHRHVHLHACVTDGVFMPAADGAPCDAPPAFIPTRPINQADLAALTERVRRRVIRWFRMRRPRRRGGERGLMRAGSGLPMPSRRTLPPGILPSGRSKETSLRNPCCARFPTPLD
jgi:hypothetical protein